MVGAATIEHSWIPRRSAARSKMRLDSIRYVQFEGQPQEWRLDELTLGPVNLLVGRNASGKSHSINVVLGLAKLLAAEIKPTLLAGKYEASFTHDEVPYRYRLEYDESGVIEEHLSIRNDTRLSRRREGGMIFAEKEGKDIDLLPPPTELAAARRDHVQHSFLEPLYQWGSSLYHYAFGTPLGKNALGILSSEPQPVNLKDSDQVIGIFRKGRKELGEPFVAVIKQDMRAMGYDITDVGIAPPISMRIQTTLGEPVCLYVQEGDLKARTDQNDMSQGMFRALSTLIQIDYLLLALRPSCILIDDVGEGLDFERSCALIEVLMHKASAGPQLVMTTNDRFVMNKVPLEMWTILQRHGGRSAVFNYTNSKAQFEEFKFTGLSNFDFFASEYLNPPSNPRE